MRILFILENYYPNIGGVETLFKSLSESLVNKGFKVTVLTNKFDKNLESQETINGVNVKRLSLSNRYLFTFFAGFKAISFARNHDIIHTTSYNAAVPAVVASLFTRKKTIITFHEVWGPLWFRLPFMNKFSLFLHYCFELFILKLPFHRFIAISNATRDNLLKSGIPDSKISMIYNGIDYTEFKKEVAVADNKKYQFCYFGRLGISKGLDLIIDAIEILKNKDVDFQFLLIVPKSPSTYLKRIKHLIRSKNIEDRVQFKHELPFSELQRNILQSDAIVIPSYSEGFCYTAIETMALGKPIISSGKGALSEVIGGQYLQLDHQTGESLSEAMNKAIGGEWENKPLRQYHLKDSVDGYIRLYEAMHL